MKVYYQIDNNSDCAMDCLDELSGDVAEEYIVRKELCEYLARHLDTYPNAARKNEKILR